MCSTKPKFITLLYFIFIIAYKLLVHLSILNDYGCPWYKEPGHINVINAATPCLWNNHLNCCSIVQFLDSIRLNSSRCWYWANFPLKFSILPEEVSKNNNNVQFGNNQSHPLSSKLIFSILQQNFATFQATVPCLHLMSFGLKPPTTKKSSSCQIFFPKLFLETDKYAGFCGILHATPSQNLQQ